MSSSSEVAPSSSDEEPAKRTRGTLQTMLGGGQIRVRPLALTEPPLAVEVLVASGEVSVMERDARGNQATLDGGVVQIVAAVEPSIPEDETMLQMLTRLAAVDKRAARILRRVSTRGQVAHEHAKNLENLVTQPRETLLRRILGIEQPAIKAASRGKGKGSTKAASSSGAVAENAGKDPQALAIEDAGKDPQALAIEERALAIEDAGKDPQALAEDAGKDTSDDTSEEQVEDAGKEQVEDAGKEQVRAGKEQVRAGFSGLPLAIGGQ